MSLRRSVGTRHCSTYAKNISPVIAPRTTIGAVILLCRKPATNVIVSQAPSGTVPITLTPRGARPRSRVRLVLTAVSSINTSRAGSSMPCSRIQRLRARATSARCRSAACRLFFEGDTVATVKPRKRTLAGVNTPPAELRDRLHQRQVWMLCNHSQYPRRGLLQWRNAPSAGFRRSASGLAPVLMPLDHRTHAHVETLGRLVSRRAHLDGLDHSFTQICGIGLWHRQSS